MRNCLLGLGIAVVGLLGCTSDPPPPEMAPPPALTAPDAKLIELLKLHNDHRQRRQLLPVQSHALLTQAAQRHATWMATNNVMSHTGEGNSTFWARLVATGYRATAAGENIAAGYATSASVFDGWLNSPGHRRNIEDSRWTHIGLGVARSGNRYFWCAVFARDGSASRRALAAEVLAEPHTVPEPIEGDEVVDAAAK